MLSYCRATPRWVLAWLIFASTAIFLHGPMPLFSTRTLSVAWDMWRLGDWMVPHMNGALYSHKTPLLLWLIQLGWAVFGVSETWPKCLMVLLGLGSLILTAKLAYQLYPQRPNIARMAPWILAGCCYYFLFSLQILYELLLVNCTLFCLLAVTLRDQQGAFRVSWIKLAIGMGLGLLAKGPVALLQIAGVIALAPLWHDCAHKNFWWWYKRLGFSILAAAGIFACWLIPALIYGDAEYRHTLLVTQTFGRVVKSFDHARAWWWYISMLPVLIFPWWCWRGFWSGIRVMFSNITIFQRPDLFYFFMCWLGVTFFAFMFVSGKQVYYLLPLLPGFSIAIAAGLEKWQQKNSAQTIRTSSIGVIVILIGVVVLALPIITTSFSVSTLLKKFSQGFMLGTVIVLIGILLCYSVKNMVDAVARIGLASLMLAVTLYLQFSMTLWPYYNIQPLANLLAQYEHKHIPIAHMGEYAGQFHFLGRLENTIRSMFTLEDAQIWFTKNPNGILIDYTRSPQQQDMIVPIYEQPFRSQYIQVWHAKEWLDKKISETDSGKITTRHDVFN